jgi:hypothetical protein
MALITIGSNGLGAGVGGKINQVIQATTTTQVQTTSGTFSSTNFSASITPSSNTSKILVQADIAYQIYGQGADSDYGGYFKIVRTLNSADTDVFNPNASIPRHYNGYTGASYSFGMYVMTELDEPSNTNECTYTIYMASRISTNNRCSLSQDSSRSTITLMELLA